VLSRDGGGRDAESRGCAHHDPREGLSQRTRRGGGRQRCEQRLEPL